VRDQAKSNLGPPELRQRVDALNRLHFSHTEKARNKWDTYPLLNDREPKQDIAMAYLCENYVCELPVSSTTELLRLIRQKTKVS